MNLLHTVVKLLPISVKNVFHKILKFKWILFDKLSFLLVNWSFFLYNYFAPFSVHQIVVMGKIECIFSNLRGN